MFINPYLVCFKWLIKVFFVWYKSIWRFSIYVLIEIILNHVTWTMGLKLFVCDRNARRSLWWSGVAELKGGKGRLKKKWKQGKKIIIMTILLCNRTFKHNLWTHWMPDPVRFFIYFFIFPILIRVLHDGRRGSAWVAFMIAALLLINKEIVLYGLIRVLYGPIRIGATALLAQDQ